MIATPRSVLLILVVLHIVSSKHKASRTVLLTLSLPALVQVPGSASLAAFMPAFVPAAVGCRRAKLRPCKAAG